MSWNTVNPEKGQLIFKKKTIPAGGRDRRLRQRSPAVLLPDSPREGRGAEGGAGEAAQGGDPAEDPRAAGGQAGGEGRAVRGGQRRHLGRPPPLRHGPHAAVHGARRPRAVSPTRRARGQDRGHAQRQEVAWAEAADKDVVGPGRPKQARAGPDSRRCRPTPQDMSSIDAIQFV